MVAMTKAMEVVLPGAMPAESETWNETYVGFVVTLILVSMLTYSVNRTFDTHTSTNC